MNIEQYDTIWRNVLPLIKWAKWFIVSLTIVLWLGLSFWVAGQVIGAILMFAIAALLAYALYPLVKLVQRFLPRGVAILVVFISIFSLLCALLYLLISVAIQQVTTLVHYIQEISTSPGSSPFTLINEALRSLGISQEQIKSVSLEA
ncbi:MAG: AI-2E family transporter, partial [Ktedonobacteraceae bacterium]